MTDSEKFTANFGLDRGSTGDINPFIALSAALAAAGHTVTLAITSTERRDYTTEGIRHGFTVRQAGHIGQNIHALNDTGMRIFRERNPLKQMSMIFGELLEPCVPEMFIAARQLAAGNDLLIGHFLVHPLYLAAEMAGKPYFTLMPFQGLVATREVPPHPLPNLGPWLNTLLWRLFESQLDRLALPSANRLRLANGAAPLTSCKSMWQSPQCNLIAVSRELAQHHADWGANQRVCGYLALPNQIEPLPPTLREFLQAGAAPIYFTFGSMMGLSEPSVELEKMIALTVEAVRLARCRAIIQTHWSAAQRRPDDTQICCVESIDHRAVFPYCAAIVHHGGAGTCQSACISGRPSIIVAHVADQFFWGDLLHRLGIAPAVIRRPALTPRMLADAIRQVLDDRTMQQRTLELGARMAAENGAHRAVEMIEAAYQRA